MRMIISDNAVIPETARWKGWAPIAAAAEGLLKEIGLLASLICDDYGGLQMRVRDGSGTVQGAVATWRLRSGRSRRRQVATAPCTMCARIRLDDYANPPNGSWGIVKVQPTKAWSAPESPQRQEAVHKSPNAGSTGLGIWRNSIHWLIPKGFQRLVYSLRQLGDC